MVSLALERSESVRWVLTRSLGELLITEEASGGWESGG